MERAIAILIGSGVFLVVGALLWQKAKLLLQTGKKAKAVIFRNNYKSSGDGGLYYPVVRFLTDKQEWITQELSTGQSPAKPEGTKVEVIYDPDEPTNVEINSTFRLEFLPRIFVAIGIAGLILGTLSFLGLIELPG